MSSSLRLVIFDLDGTLVHFPHDYLLDEAERIIPLLDHPPIDRSELFEHFASFDFFRFVLHENRDEFVETFWSHFDWERFPKPIPFPSTLSVLSELKLLGFSLAIATARLMPSETLRRELEATGILEHIPHLVTREDERVDWRDKRGHLKQICEALGFSPAESVMVGDIPTDISSAKDLRFGRTVAVTTGGLKRAVLEAIEPDHIIEDLTHLPLLLRTAGARDSTSIPSR